MPRHISDVQLRWADMDAFSHVNNVVFLRYLQEARVDMLFVYAARHGAEGLANGVVVSRHEVSYRAPLRFRPSPVRVETWVREVRAASFTLGYEVVDADASGGRKVHAVATSTLVPYDLATGRPRRIRDEERAVLEAFLESDGPVPRPAEEQPPTATTADPAHAPVRYHYPCRVRFDDLDSYGHVNNVTYVEYLQEARIDWAARHLTGIGRLAEGVVVAHQSIDYLTPVAFRTDALSVDVWVTRVGRSSFDLAYEVRDDETTYARGLTTLVAFDVHTGSSRELLSEERMSLESLLGVPA